MTTFVNHGTIGYDLSKWQDNPDTIVSVDFNKLRETGASFVILRVGQGNFIDRAWSAYRVNSRGILPRAGYWYYDPRYDPLLQADLLLNALSSERLEGRIWTDLEFEWPGTFYAPRHWQKFQDALKAEGYRTGVYTRQTWWEGRGADMGYWGREPFWLAQYNHTLDLIPSGLLLPPMIWQNTILVVGPEYGVESRELDHNIWNSYFTFSQEWGEYPVPQDPGEPMPTNPLAKYKVVSTAYNMTLRDNHNTGAIGSESVPVNTPMYADEIWTATEDLYKSINGNLVKVNSVGDKWAHVIEVNGAAKDKWTAIVHNGHLYCTYEELNPVPSGVPAHIDMSLAAGSTVTIKDSEGNVLWTGTA